jgi:hypothetical protein
VLERLETTRAAQQASLSLRSLRDQ